jgi:hypothetical protein
MTAQQHAALLEVLAGIRGRFLLSGYRSPLYDRAAARHGWTRHDQQIDCKVGGNGGREKSQRIESIWINEPQKGEDN